MRWKSNYDMKPTYFEKIMNVNLKFLFHIIKLCFDIFKILVFLVIQLDPHKMNLKKKQDKRNNWRVARNFIKKFPN